MTQLEFDYPPMFEIDEEYLVSVTRGFKQNDEEFNGAADHPAFIDLRIALNRQGFINMCLIKSNNDIVKKLFYLNGVPFFEGETFYCAASLPGHLNFSRKYASAWSNITDEVWYDRRRNRRKSTDNESAV